MPRPGYDPAARARLLQRKVKGEHFLHLPADFIHIEYFFLLINLRVFYHHHTIFLRRTTVTTYSLFSCFETFFDVFSLHGFVVYSNKWS